MPGQLPVSTSISIEAFIDDSAGQSYAQLEKPDAT
jgi:hypothetical protein